MNSRFYKIALSLIIVVNIIALAFMFAKMEKKAFGGTETQSFYAPTLSTAAVGPDLFATVVATNTARRFLSISNISSTGVALCLDASTCTIAKGIMLFASSTITFDPSQMPTGTITGKGYASTTLLVTEK